MASSCNFLLLPLSSRYESVSFRFLDHHKLPYPTLLRSSSACAIRATRKLMSDAELCDNLRQFAASIGLPDCDCPSMKILKDHGRKDLANIVRRRGYRAVKELLALSTAMGTSQLDLHASSSRSQGELCDREDDIVGQENKEKTMSGKLEDVLLINDVCESGENSETDIGHGNEGSEIEENSELYSAASVTDQSSNSKSRDLHTSSLQAKLVKFMEFGELEMFGDKLSNTVKVNGCKDGYGFVDTFGTKPVVHAEGKNEAVSGAAVTSLLRDAPAANNNQMRSDYSSAKGSEEVDCDEYVNIEMRKSEVGDDIEHLKSILLKKEGELSQLKDQIEKEKQALFILQSKLENELDEARKLISELDKELQSTEESLSGLKEAQIYYFGEGDVVEVAGSFNGWHQRIVMDLLEPSSATIDIMQPSSCVTHPMQPSSSATNPAESRTSRAWYTALWLYPGVYEIKFIVDGQWKIDPAKETVRRCGIQNNILRVDR